jgi:hypothetical protein
MTIPNPKWDDSGPQIILKDDFKNIETAILEASGLIAPPNLVWDSTTTIHVAATPDSLASVLMSGFPNVLQGRNTVNVGRVYSDGMLRTVDADITVQVNQEVSRWDTSLKAYQWYAVYAVATDEATDFNVKCMPLIRFKSSPSSKVIAYQSNIAPASNYYIGYGFETDSLVGDTKGGWLYVLSGTHVGLVRTITANNDNNSDGAGTEQGTITYTGDELVSLADGDWLAIFPPDTNFRLLGYIYCKSDKSVAKFHQEDRWVSWLEAMALNIGDDSHESIACGPPTAVAIGVMGSSGSIGHPDGDVVVSLGTNTDSTYAPELQYAMVTQKDGGLLPIYWEVTSADYNNKTQSILPGVSVTPARSTFAEVMIKNCKCNTTGSFAGLYGVYYRLP